MNKRRKTQLKKKHYTQHRELVSLLFWSLLICVPCVLKMCSRDNVPRVLTCSRANVPCLLTCQRILRAYVLTWQRSLRAYVLTCQRRLRAHMLTCQHLLNPLPHTAGVSM